MVETYRACEVCGGPDPQLMLESDRLDGPLVRCKGCGFVYVGSRRDNFTFEQADAIKSSRLAHRVRHLGLFDSATEEAEAPWRRAIAAERLRDIQACQPDGWLLEIGSADGAFLSLALSAGYRAIGLEADPHTSALGRSRGLDIRTGTLSDVRFLDDQFDVVALYHVIEHLGAPRHVLSEVGRILRSGGLLAVETPNVDTLWLELLGPRWRQFIPDHYFFFSPRTISRLLDDTGFDVLRIARVGKPMSLRLFLNRLGRFHRGVGQVALTLARLTRMENFTLRLNLGDVMRVHARHR